MPARSRFRILPALLTVVVLLSYTNGLSAAGNHEHYLSGGSVMVEMVQQETGAGSCPGSTTGTKVLYYGYQDHLGSLTALVRERINGNGNGNGSISRIVADYRSYDAWGRLRENDDWTLPRTSDLQITDRGYTCHEHLQSFGIINMNMNGRVYDPLTAQFFSPDPYVQAPGLWLNYNRYSYCLDNPLIYTDPSGEYVLADDLIAAGIGGFTNLIINLIYGNIHNFGQGLAAFGAGAVGGIGGLYPEFGGWVWGGAVVGATNAWLGGTTDPNDILIAAGVGVLSSLVGGAVGQWAGQNLGGVVINGFNVASPVLKGTVTGAIGGAAGGYAGGFAAELIITGDLKAANSAGLNGLWSGAAVGGIVGGGAGYKYAIDNEINPWSGVRENSVTIGEGMTRVESATKDMGNTNINESWPEGMEAYYSKPERIVNADAIDFNGQWINTQMENNVYLYDIGTPNGGPINSPFYNMEVGRSMFYPRVVPVKYFQIQRYIRISIIGR